MAIHKVTKKVLVLLETPTLDSQSYGVVVPHIPGCFSGGDTRELALEHVKEAIIGHTELEPVDGDVCMDDQTTVNMLDYPEFEIAYIDAEVYVNDIVSIDPVLRKITHHMPRAAVGAIIVNPEGEILMCRRPHGPENYVGRLHTFGGKIDLGETMYDAIVREIREECNIDVTQAWKKDMVGMIEEIEPEASYTEQGILNMYHWVSGIWVFWMKTNDFINMEPHKHLDMGWRDVETLDKLDIAPSAYHSMVLAGIFDPSESWTTVTDKVPLY